MAKPSPRIGDGVTGIELGTLYAVWEMVPCTKAVGASPLFLRHGLGVDGGFAPFVLVDTLRATLVRVVRNSSRRSHRALILPFDSVGSLTPWSVSPSLQPWQWTRQPSCIMLSTTSPK